MPKVLIVDDQQDIRELYCYLFEESGVTVRCLDSGTDAIEWLAQSDNSARVVLLDLSMPALDGLTVAEEIRRNEEIGRFRHVEIAFLTGRNIDGAIERVAEKCSVRKIFSKTDAPEDVVAEIIGWMQAQVETVEDGAVTKTQE